jgi:hypothetical protein
VKVNRMVYYHEKEVTKVSAGSLKCGSNGAQLEGNREF